LCDITQGLTDQLGQIERGGLFDGGRTGAFFFFRRSPTSMPPVRTPARDLILVGPFYWGQNDRARSFCTRSILIQFQTPDAAHAATDVAVRH
jgi:hypothetical protein